MLLSAFILGLVGSLHCAGMCGALALAVPAVNPTRAGFLVSRLLYNAGRIATYTAIGALFGLVGETLSLAGFQGWLSLAAGAFILLGLIFAKISLNNPAANLVIRIKRIFGNLLLRRSYPALFALGAVNGLLPCGLVYVAAAAATATGHVLTAAEYMVAFGLGTLPVLLAIPILGRKIAFNFNYQKLVPISVALVALMLILRGLALDIPFISPDLAAGHCSACH